MKYFPLKNAAINCNDIRCDNVQETDIIEDGDLEELVDDIVIQFKNVMKRFNSLFLISIIGEYLIILLHKIIFICQIDISYRFILKT